MPQAESPPSLDFELPDTPVAGPSKVAGGRAPKRAKTGCITCRVRKKRCDEAKPFCNICQRLGIECMGYGEKRPRWMRGEGNSLKVREELSQKIHKAKVRKSGRHFESESVEASDEHDESPPAAVNTVAPPDGGGVEATWSNWDDTAFQESSSTLPLPAGLPAGQSTFEVALANGTGLPPETALFPIHQATTNANTTYSPPDAALDEIWRLLFDPSSPEASNVAFPSMPFIPSPLALPNPSAYSTFPIASPPPPPAAPTLPFSYFQSPLPAPPPPMDSTSDMSPTALFGSSTGLSEMPTMPDLTYLHHYLNVVLPLQFRLICKSIADLVAPLAMTHHQVLSSVSSLAALHLVSQRVHAPLALTPEGEARPTGGQAADGDAIVATSSHQSAVSRLRFLSSQDLTKEDVIVSALFAVSFHLFRGGTDPGWVVALDTARRCLGVVIASSPELRGASIGPPAPHSPWQRYGPLIAVMVWMDIIGSVTQNKPSNLLPMYRKVLRHLPTSSNKGRSLRMERVMGCDNTTFLAYAEIVQLSSYRSACEAANCLSMDEIHRRAFAIEQLLDERGWRESTLDIVDPGGPELDEETRDLIRIMSDVFYHAARAFLGSVVHGHDPTATQVSTPVSDLISTLSLLDILHPSRVKEIDRGLILPITLAGCLAATPDQHAFFRSRFANLGKDAEAFGNSKQARELIDEVWNRRVSGVGGGRVDFREVMRDLGWEKGILLI